MRNYFDEDNLIHIFDFLIWHAVLLFVLKSLFIVNNNNQSHQNLNDKEHISYISESFMISLKYKKSLQNIYYQ